MLCASFREGTITETSGASMGIVAEYSSRDDLRLNLQSTNEGRSTHGNVASAKDPQEKSAVIGPLSAEIRG
jgi:hypothetical protein